MASSLQQTAGPSKAAKFVQANPLDPMIRPFGNDDNDQDIQATLAENVNKRLEKAMEELKEKHRSGTNQTDHPDRSPTGPIYQYVDTQRQQALAQQKKRLDMLQQQQEAFPAPDDNESDDNESDDDAWLDDDNDPILAALRQQRLQELKQQQAKHAENIAKGHGQVRTISQDEFLPECTSSSEWVSVHFYHKEFPRCDILDHHLKIIAPRHTECKFLRLDAEKAPFFVHKLSVRTLPTLLVFQHGKLMDRLTGFEKLAVDDSSDPDTWKTTRLQEWLAGTGAIEYTPSKEEALERMGADGVNRARIYRGELGNHYDDEC